MDAEQWDQRYDQADLVWSAAPNRWVEEVTGSLSPGRVLDLAAGEGRNALWLAGRGWRATAVDFSRVALDRAGQHRRESSRPARPGPSTPSVPTCSTTAQTRRRTTWCWWSTCRSPSRSDPQSSARPPPRSLQEGCWWSSRTTATTWRTATAGHRTLPSSTRRPTSPWTSPAPGWTSSGASRSSARSPPTRARVRRWTLWSWRSVLPPRTSERAPQPCSTRCRTATTRSGWTSSNPSPTGSWTSST